MAATGLESLISPFGSVLLWAVQPRRLPAAGEQQICQGWSSNTGKVWNDTGMRKLTCLEEHLRKNIVHLSHGDGLAKPWLITCGLFTQAQFITPLIHYSEKREISCHGLGQGDCMRKV